MKAFKIATTATSIAITSPSGATFTTTVTKVEGKGNAKRLVSTMKNAEGKDKQYGYYINKFVRVLVSLFPKTLSYEARFARVAKKLEGAKNSPSVRAYSSNIRKVTNDGTLYPINLYFYEGKMKSIPEVDVIEDEITAEAIAA